MEPVEVVEGHEHGGDSRGVERGVVGAGDRWEPGHDAQVGAHLRGVRAQRRQGGRLERLGTAEQLEQVTPPHAVEVHGVVDLVELLGGQPGDVVPRAGEVPLLARAEHEADRRARGVGEPVLGEQQQGDRAGAVVVGAHRVEEGVGVGGQEDLAVARPGDVDDEVVPRRVRRRTSVARDLDADLEAVVEPLGQLQRVDAAHGEVGDRAVRAGRDRLRRGGPTVPAVQERERDAVVVDHREATPDHRVAPQALGAVLDEAAADRARRGPRPEHGPRAQDAWARAVDLRGVDRDAVAAARRPARDRDLFALDARTGALELLGEELGGPGRRLGAVEPGAVGAELLEEM